MMIGFSYSVVLCLYFLSSRVFAQDPVNLKWNIAKIPIFFGSDIELICNIPCDSKDTITSWAIENGDLVTLAENTLVKNDSKYSILTNRNECRLVIKNFGPNDANKNYSCYQNYKRYSANLTLDALNFEQQPSTIPISTLENIDEQEFQISFNLTDVFPEPQCHAEYNKLNITPYIKTDAKKDGMLYTSKINLHHRIVEGAFNIKCSIGTKSHHIKEIRFYKMNIDKSSGSESFVVVGILSFVSLTTMITTAVFAYKYFCKNQPIVEITQENDNTEMNQSFPIDINTDGNGKYFGVQEEPAQEVETNTQDATDDEITPLLSEQKNVQNNFKQMQMQRKEEMRRQPRTRYLTV